MPKEKESKSVAIIGGGAVGLAIARELSQAGYEVFLFEQAGHFGQAQSTRNSGVIHAGIYYKPDSLKAVFCVKGSRMLYEFCCEQGVPFLKTGKMIVAQNEAEDRTLDFYLLRGRENGVEGLCKISRSELKELEPGIEGYSALYSSETGIFDAGEYVKVLARLADEAGAQLFRNMKVVGIQKRGSGFELCLVDARVPEEQQEPEIMEFDRIINSAGAHADEIAVMVNPENRWRVIPVRGEYYCYSSAKKPGLAIRHCVYGLPTETAMPSGGTVFGLGIHLVPTVEADGWDAARFSDIVLVGPSTKIVGNKDDYASDLFSPEHFLSAVQPVLPYLELGDLKEGYAGIRAELAGCDDFVIQADSRYGNCVHLLGIRSPGLTASLAIARYVKNGFF